VIEVRRLYLEIGYASFPWVVKAALEFFGSSRLLFGTDYPVESHEVTTRNIPFLWVISRCFLRIRQR
jgi:predicted TIM-barrel fold metal-dependent hydrolase